jgi:hypothetical protein
LQYVWSIAYIVPKTPHNDNLAVFGSVFHGVGSDKTVILRLLAIFYSCKGITTMNNKSLKFWSNWLVVIAELTGLFGILMVLSPDFFRNIFYGTYTDFFYGAGAFDALPSTEFAIHLWMYALAGSIMMAWMVLIGIVALIPFRRGEKWAWWAMVATLAVWFVFDSGSSVIYGMSINVIINTVSLISFAIPLAMTYRTFFGTSAEKSELVPSQKVA